nr:MAG TPA: hypothetical protein [Caudoviricetes sp.]
MPTLNQLQIIPTQTRAIRPHIPYKISPIISSFYSFP